MSERTLKLGAVLMGVGGPGQDTAWLDPDVPVDASVDIRWYIARAQEAEAAKFDFIFIADSQFITADSPNHYLSRLEPLTLLSAVAVHTSHIGLVATLTTSYNEPFNLARRFASLDHISRGRAGWNVVTSGDAGVAGNFSRDEHYDYETRYGRALEHVQIAQGLWDSYEADAFPRDKRRGSYVDRSKLHPLHHKGEYYSVVGPLNLERSPQGQPVIFQAGDSVPGRGLGAQVGEAIFTLGQTLQQAQEFRREMRALVARQGRDPDHVLIVPGLSPVLADSDAEARAKQDAVLGGKSFGRALAELGRPFGWHDFSQYDLDAPFPELPDDLGQNAFRTQAEGIKKLARHEGLTLRQVVQAQIDDARSPFVGSPLTVANEIQRWFEAGAIDGINLFASAPSDYSLFLNEVVPILRERGVVRREYDSTTLRGNLGLPIPENRYTAARRASAASEVAETPRASGERAPAIAH
jgi:FMN-dependent oxidoreductase (nitrilotriacetate monooxygenase family)